MIRPARDTPWQLAMQAAFDLVADAREQLDPRAFRLFIDCLCTLAASEAARCVRWELERPDEADES